ncbi:retinoblastoma-related protein isoform X3 [Cryptomeria japonica]|uniref:retinoblastoma-related protein isoform X3 n=1 Tax=Cryptomeria japonica TaxID=3369 RepID=UPI0027DA830B|nr:retinoblastoma-related protein isoform X3 [Cryptomeria japonica]
MSPGSLLMEDIKPSTRLNGLNPEEDSMEARLKEFCQRGLSLEEETTEQALRLFRETKDVLLANMKSLANGNAEENERFWFSCVLYSVKRLNGGNTVSKINQEDNDTGFTLSQILRVAKLNILDFFKEMPQFFLKAGSIINKLYGIDSEKRLQTKELQANFVHLTVLYKYYKRVYQDFFLSGDSTQDAVTNGSESVLSGIEPVSNYLRFGWMLFLALRIHVFSRFKDLVTCTNGLVSILAILILHVPIRCRSFSFNDSTRFVRKGGKGVDLISSLCNIYHTSEEDLLKTIDKANALIVDILKKNPYPASECHTEELKDIDTDGLTYFQDLVEESSIVSSIRILERDYEDAIHDRGELDERMFVNEEDSLFGSGSVSGGNVNITGLKRKYDAISSPTKTITSPLSPPGSPLTSPVKESSTPSKNKMPPPSTPVSTTMTTAKWLRTVITPLPAKPSSELEQFLSSCERDIKPDVIRRAQIILEAIFPSSAPVYRCVAGSLQSAALMDSIWAEQRRLEALKLYYRVLSAMCRAESQRLRSSNLTSLLTNERFHRCMLACSAELVLATHKTVTMMFPAVLERAGITAFDLSKVIESFVRHEETLPRELKRHLNSLEERLLESMAWEKGSSIYNSLIVAKPGLLPVINQLGLLAEPMPSLDTIAMHHNLTSGNLQLSTIPHKSEAIPDNNIAAPSSPQRHTPPVVSIEMAVGVSGVNNSFVSPAKDRSSAFLAFSSTKSRLQPPLQTAFASPTRPCSAGGGETCAETGINVFFQKVLKLAAIRIKGLSERLNQPIHVMEQVYRLVKCVLNQETSLFFNRHIDQVILCSYYGISKVSGLGLAFREIVAQYRKQPQCKPQVFRNVFIDWSLTNHPGKTGQDTVDIIAFYNEVFVHTMKPFLVQFAPNAAPGNHNHSSEDPDKNEGPSPGSPGPSPFPSLPDMSPKKVSAAHNVYVSPLRSSKRETLISSHSKSLYACVGESTHAYQSPSKDLTAINNRLNSRRVSGRLNFDDAGLVSDTLVAGSLYTSQNPGNLTSDSVLSQSQSLPWTTSASPLKRRQTDR